MLKDVYKEAEDRMKGAIQSLEDDLAGIRTGRAHPALVEKLHVEYYGDSDAARCSWLRSASQSPLNLDSPIRCDLP